MNIVIDIKPISYYQYLAQNKFRKYITTRGREYKQTIENIFIEYMEDKELLLKNIKVEVDFYFNNKRKNDLENYVKPILDFGSEIIYKDDCQITDLHIKKFYDKERPRIEIKIEEL
jgi:Holliday junction resolvase RusA-like endonuclease